MFSVRDVAQKYEKSVNLELITLDDQQIQRIQEICLNMYKDILAVCKKKNLTVILGGGSALGAVRHKGLIPWDDDIDLMMPRKDFNTFMDIFDSELGEKYYIACPHKRYSTQYNYIVKVIDKDTICEDLFEKRKLFHQGIAIDIGAIDYVPDASFLYHIKGWISIVLLFIINSNMMYHCKTKLSDTIFTQSSWMSIYYYSRLFIGLLSSLFPYYFWTSLFDNFIASSRQTSRMSIPSGRNHYFKETKPANVFLPPKEIVFEDTKGYIPNDVNEYLKGLYGENYMVIPPEDKREKHICSKLKI